MPAQSVSSQMYQLCLKLLRGGEVLDISRKGQKVSLGPRKLYRD